MNSLTSHRRTRRTRALVAFGAVATIVAAVLVAGPGYPASQLRMLAGTVWLASNRTATATLVDGATAEAAAEVEIGAPTSGLSVAQHGSDALVLDQATGVLSRIASATVKISGSSAVLPASQGLVVRASPDAIYGVDVHSGMVASVDPDTLAVTEPKRLADQVRPDNVAVDGRGRLWAVDDETGDLVWLTGGERRTRPAAARTGRLAIIGDRPALVDPERRTAELLDPETGTVVRSVWPDLGPGDVVAVSGVAGGARLLIANSTRGELVACTFDGGACAAPVRVGAPGDDLGAPVEAGDHAVVPDYSTGQAAIVDLDASRLVTRRELFSQAKRFELLAHDGIVFFNDPDGSVAGVLDLSGGVKTITKYAERPSAADVAPKPDHRVQQQGQATKTDHRHGKPGIGKPGLPNDLAPNPVPAPVPALSIEVAPREHGEVGDEFELTAVLRNPNVRSHVQWRFGDGTEATGATVRHSWNLPGTFTVRAVATFDRGVESQAEIEMFVEPAGAPPHISRIDVLRQRPVIGESVHFSAQTSGDPEDWAWSVTRAGQLVPEATAGTPEFDHAFTTAGTYTVALTVTSGRRTAQFSRQFTVVRGTVKLWGDNPRHELDVPPGAGSGVTAVDAGRSHALALKSDGTVLVWGAKNQTNIPEEAQHGVAAIAAAGDHSLVLKTNGSVLAWGSDGPAVVDVPPAAQHDVIAIATGNKHSLALKRDGTVVGWGDSDSLGVIPTLKGITAIGAGYAHSLAVRADTVLFSGNANCNSKAPVKNVLMVAGGKGSCLALHPEGTIFAWGSGEQDQTSVPDEENNGIATMDISFLHGLALKLDGSVIGWGWDKYGQASVPPQFSKGAMAVAAGETFSMVVLE